MPQGWDVREKRGKGALHIGSERSVPSWDYHGRGLCFLKSARPTVAHLRGGGALDSYREGLFLILSDHKAPFVGDLVGIGRSFLRARDG